jgi:hypothetical protein
MIVSPVLSALPFSGLIADAGVRRDPPAAGQKQHGPGGFVANPSRLSRNVAPVSGFSLSLAWKAKE